MKSIGEDLRSNYDKWESMIKQKSRLNCASQVDANTKFFHNFVKYRQRKNSIHGILVNIIWITSPAQIKVAFYNHFSCFFNLSSIGQAFKLGNLVGSKLTVSQANDLEKDISTSELFAAIQEMDVNKAPGPDGINLGFIKHFWNILHEDIL